MSVVVCEDAAVLAERAADFILQAGADAIRERGRFTLVLTGGSTPEKTYALLARPDRAALLDWQRTYLFFGDERLVPPDDPRSNYGMARRSLISQVSVPADQVFAMPTDCPADVAATRYAEELKRFFPGVKLPSFDLVLLGMGEDGHTASLFPGAAALKVTDAWATWSKPGRLPPPVDRVTLTFPVFNAARQVAFLAAGSAKAEALSEVLAAKTDVERRPACGIRPTSGSLTWFVDRAAKMAT